MELTKNPPDLNTLLDILKAEIFASFNCVKPGKIISYDLATGTAQIQLVIKGTIDQTKVLEYPILVDCPVFVLQGGGSFLEFPIKKGDFCLVLFSDQNIDVWWSKGTETIPATGRKHSLSDGFALVGLNTKVGPLATNGGPRIFTGAEKFQVENNAKKISVAFDDMFTRLNTLISDLKNIVTVGSSTTQTLNPATIANLEADRVALQTSKSDFDSLLGDN